MPKTMTIQDLRNMVAGHNGEDRISTLPDELIHYILSFLDDAKDAVGTCVLSKRWVNLWTTLPYLDFHLFSHRNVDWCKFISQFLLKRNQDSDTTRVSVIANNSNLPMTSQIIDYAIRHNVKHLHLRTRYLYMDSNYNKSQKLNFPVLETLHLSYFKQPLEYWSMPSLTILHLEGVLMNYHEQALSFERFHNLKELTLIQYKDIYYNVDGEISNMDDLNVDGEISNMDDLMIESPNLERLTLCWQLDDYELYPICKFVISSPKLSAFKFCGDKYVPVLSVEGGIPCLKELDLDLDLGLDDCEENIKNELMEKVNCLFCEFRGIKFLRLSWSTVEVLVEYSKIWPCPFDNLKTLHLEYSRENNFHVINYLLPSSPDMKIFIEDDHGQIASYNPEDDMLLDSGYQVAKSKKRMASSISVDTALLRRVIGVSYHNDVSFSLWEGHRVCNDVSFSLWEGHRVYTEYLMLLRYIKEKQPETFENFAPQTGCVYTIGLFTLCSSIKALSEVYSFPAPTISSFRTIFTDLKIWGFNTTWLLNILNNISGTPTDLINE